MDLTIVTTALYTIALDFGSLADTYWIILAYSLTELGRLSTHWILQADHNARLYCHLHLPQRLPRSTCDASGFICIVLYFLDWCRVCYIAYPIDLFSSIPGRWSIWLVCFEYGHHVRNQYPKNASLSRWGDWWSGRLFGCDRTSNWRSANTICKLEMDFLDHVCYCLWLS